MRLIQAFDNPSFLLCFLLFTCQIIVVRAQSATLASTAGPTQTSGPATSTYEQGWKPSPKTRGTSDILRSCFETIILALWSSVILNVQVGRLAYWIHKLVWAVVNIVAPELVLGIALDERRTVRALLEVLRYDPEITECRQIFQGWDETVGFYAVTGGFYV